jgi:hypothetical protein
MFGVALAAIGIGAGWFLRGVARPNAVDVGPEHVFEGPAGSRMASVQVGTRIAKGFAPPQGELKQSRAQVSYPGEAFDPPKALTPAERATQSFATPESALAAMYAANKSNDLDWILETYAPDEREATKAALTSEEIKRNNALAANISALEILERVEYGESYVVLIVAITVGSGTRFVHSIPMKKTEAGWFSTNELSDDPFFTSVLWAVREYYE